MSRGLGDTQRAALTALADHDGTMTMHALADALCCTRTGAAHVVDGLRRAGLVWTTYEKRDTGRTWTQRVRGSDHTVEKPILEGPYKAHVHLGDPTPDYVDAYPYEGVNGGRLRVWSTNRYGYTSWEWVDEVKVTEHELSQRDLYAEVSA